MGPVTSAVARRALRGGRARTGRRAPRMADARVVADSSGLQPPEHPCVCIGGCGRVMIGHVHDEASAGARLLGLGLRRLVVACGSSQTQSGGRPWPSGLGTARAAGRHVQGDGRPTTTIQSVVDVASPCDWILVGAASDYHETADIDHPPTPAMADAGGFGGVLITSRDFTSEGWIATRPSSTRRQDRLLHAVRPCGEVPGASRLARCQGRPYRPQRRRRLPGRRRLRREPSRRATSSAAPRQRATRSGGTAASRAARSE